MLTYIITFAAIIGTIANSLHKRWCFIIWAFTNAFWVGYWILAEEYAAALLYAVNFILSIVGLIKWKRDSSARMAEDIFRYGGDFLVGNCPKCKIQSTNVAGNEIAETNYCPNCGQHIRWKAVKK